MEGKQAGCVRDGFTGNQEGMAHLFFLYFSNFNLSSEALSFGHECSQSAVSSISTNMTFSLEWRQCALSLQFFQLPLSGFSGSALECSCNNQ